MARSIDAIEVVLVHNVFELYTFAIGWLCTHCT